MFSKNGNRVFKTVAFRLTLWYVGLLTLLALSAFGLIYVRLTTDLSRRLDDNLVSDAREFEALYSKQPLPELQAEFQREASSNGIKRVYFRLLSPGGVVLAHSDMSNWRELDRQRPPLADIAAQKEFFQNVSIPGKKYKIRVFYQQISEGQILEVGHTLEDNELLMRKYRETFGIGLLIILVPGSIIGWLVAGRAMSGVKRVTQTAVHIGKGDLTSRVPVKNEGQEIRRLALAFNRMLERIQLLVTELQEVSNNVAHDLRSPITRIRGIAETTLTGGQQLKHYKKMASTVVEECDRLTGMINTMLEIAETQSGAAHFSPVEIDAVRLVANACELFRPVAEDKNISLEFTASDDSVFICGDLGKLQRVISNLLDNAICYTPCEGQISVSVGKTEEAITISIQDTGMGINEQDLPHIFERFYRADQSRTTPGNGLGLSLAQALIQAHNGCIRVKSFPGRGSCFTIHLPTLHTD